jgi:thiamine biosynthesis lipoprotein
MTVVRRAFRAMGTSGVVIVVGGAPSLADLAVDLVATCEQRWSRFRDDSELAELNRSDGRPVLVEPDTFDLVSAAVRCWHLTAGRFDPTILSALVAAGYDRSFDDASRVAGPPAPAPGCGEIVLDADVGAITLPEGVSLDLGGIAKGHTADLVAAELIYLGAAGALVDLGGDVRVEGESPSGEGWRVAISDPFDEGADLAIVQLDAGGVATSSVRRRRWMHEGRLLHHLIDPATGAPAASGITAVSVVAASAAWAEVTAKAALVAGRADAVTVVRAAGATGVVVGDDGTVWRLDGMERFA